MAFQHFRFKMMALWRTLQRYSKSDCSRRYWGCQSLLHEQFLRETLNVRQSYGRKILESMADIYHGRGMLGMIQGGDESTKFGGD
jgi:hypothetical protein